MRSRAHRHEANHPTALGTAVATQDTTGDLTSLGGHLPRSGEVGAHLGDQPGVMTRSLGPQRPTTRRLVLALPLSLASAVLAGVGALSGADDPLTDPSRVPLAMLVPGTALIVTAVLVGLAGAVAAVLALVARPTAPLRPRRLLIAVALAEVIVFGLALQGLSALSTAGYLIAFCLPTALVVLTIQVVRRYPAMRWLVLTLIPLAMSAGVLAGPLRPATLSRLLGDLGTGFVATGAVMAYAVLFMTTAIVWATVALAELSGCASIHRMTAWATRHRRVLTIVAATGPLPYALVRSTWLTPWALAAPEPGELGTDLRLWGLLLGGAAAAGVVLTLGLIRPWGERFPRWVPGLANRPVPVAAAAVSGGIVAALVSAAAAPMIIGLTVVPAADGVGGGFSLAERLGCLLLFPFWIWGPALALAVWGYVGHRAAAPAEGPVLTEDPRTPVAA